jgi:replicative DNA helicase
MREQEERLIARTFYTYGAELPLAETLTEEDFTEPHLAEIWGAIKQTCQNPKTWSSAELFSLKLSSKARETLLSPPWFQDELGKTNYFVLEIKKEAQLKHAKKISDLYGSINSGNLETRLEEIKKLNQLLERPLQVETEKTPLEKIIDFVNSLQGEPDFIESNSPALNELIEGFYPGRLYVLAARTGLGKTAVALNFAWGLKGRAKVGFYSLEMTETEILKRLITIETGLSSRRIKKRADQETNEIMSRQFVPEFSEAGFGIFTSPQGFTMAQLRAHALNLKEQGQLDFLVIDQLDAIVSTGKLAYANPFEKLTFHSQQVKKLALELNVPVILLAQINREGEDKPGLIHLKGSGQIEQDADLVFILSGNPEPSQRTELKLTLAKNRHGSTGAVFYGWQGELMRITEPKSNHYTKPSFNPADTIRATWTTAGTAF